LKQKTENANATHGLLLSIRGHDSLCIMPSTTITLPGWIQRARGHLSEEDYLEWAIAVASELTHLLGLIAGVGNDPDPKANASFFISSWDESLVCRVQIEDIELENVFLSVANDSNTTSDLSSLAYYGPRELTIQPSATNSKRNVGFYTHKLPEQKLCFALGKLLFGLFSEDSALFLTEPQTEESINALNVGFTNSDVGDGDFDLASPKLKKTTMTMGDIGAFLSSSTRARPLTKSMKAKNSLQAQNLPIFICYIVSDLLDAEEGNPYVADTALLSLKETQQHLLQMVLYRERFLHDHLCPEKALDMTALFNQAEEELYGRETELNILMDATSRVSPDAPSQQHFLCEAAFISGSSGSGKSLLIKRLISDWNDRDLSVLFCKFDRQASPLSILMQSLDAYFGKFITLARDLSMPETLFGGISQSIISSIDRESFIELCQLLPSFGQLFSNYGHLSGKHGPKAQQEECLSSFMDQTSRVNNASSSGNIGSGKNRLVNLINIIFKAVCNGGQPVLLCESGMKLARFRFVILEVCCLLTLINPFPLMSCILRY